MLRSNPPKWLWIGNSNTKHQATHFDNDIRKFSLCTKLEHYKAEVERAPDNCDHLTVSGFDTLVADIAAGKDISPEDLETELDKIFSTLDAHRSLGMKIVIEPLLPWKRHSEVVKRAAIGAFKAIKAKYTGMFFPPKPDSLSFVNDGVHLKDRAASRLFKHMYDHSRQFFDQKDDQYVSGMETDEDRDSSLQTEEEIEIIATGSNPSAKTRSKQGINEKGKSAGRTPGKKVFTSRTKVPAIVDCEEDDDEANTHSLSHPAFNKLLREFKEFKLKVEKRWTIDHSVSAGTKEDMDKVETEKNMNKIILTGIEIHDLWAENLTWPNKLDKIKKAVADLINIIDPEGTYELGYVRHLNHKLKASRQIFEITMGSETQAKMLRKAYGARVKTWREEKNFPDEVKGTSISPSLTLATRVRIAIMKILAKELKERKEDIDAWVIQHVARPVLKIEETGSDDTKILKSFGFAQAITYFQKECPHVHLSSQVLYDAYSLAGIRFGLELSHYFVILDSAVARNIAFNRKPRQKNQQEAKKNNPRKK